MNSFTTFTCRSVPTCTSVFLRHTCFHLQSKDWVQWTANFAETENFWIYRAFEIHFTVSVFLFRTFTSIPCILYFVFYSQWRASFGKAGSRWGCWLNSAFEIEIHFPLILRQSISFSAILRKWKWDRCSTAWYPGWTRYMQNMHKLYIIGDRHLSIPGLYSEWENYLKPDTCFSESREGNTILS